MSVNPLSAGPPQPVAPVSGDDSYILVPPIPRLGRAQWLWLGIACALVCLFSFACGFGSGFGLSAWNHGHLAGNAAGFVQGIMQGAGIR